MLCIYAYKCVIFFVTAYQPDQLTDEALRSRYHHQNDVLAFVPNKGNEPGPSLSRTDVQKLEVEKFLDDVRYVNH